MTTDRNRVQKKWEMRSQHQFFDQLEDGLPVCCTKKLDSWDCFWTVHLLFPYHIGLESFSSSTPNSMSITSTVSCHPAKNEQTWKGQRKILKARWANLWQNTSDDVLRGKILVSWAIEPVSYPTVPATHDAPLQRGMGERRLLRFLFPSFLFSSACLFFGFPLEFRTGSELLKIFTVYNKHLGMRYVGLSSTEGRRILLKKGVRISTSHFPKT